jgi:hypothetical protein
MKTKRSQQRGFIAVFVIVMVAIAAMTALTTKIWGSGDTSVYEQKITHDALQKAKEGILAYLSSNGRLPCPTDVTTSAMLASSEGSTTTPCGVGANGNAAGISSIGLVPWKTLGMPVPKDSQSECIWYAVSGNMKASNSSTGINADSDGLFEIRNVYGTVIDNTSDSKNKAVAILFSPGSPTTTGSFAQSRSAPSNVLWRPTCKTTTGTTNIQAAKQYLDSASVAINGVQTTIENWNISTTANAPKTFVQGYVNGAFPLGGMNDQLAWITADEFGKASTQYAASQIALVLKDFYITRTNNKFYPSPASDISTGNCNTSLKKGYLPMLCTTGGTLWGTSGNGVIEKESKALITDKWHERTHYVLSDKCKSGTTYCGDGLGDLSVDTSSNLHTIVIVRGRDSRACTSPESCFESSINVTAAGSSSIKIYESPLKTKGNNDMLGYTK